MNTTDTYTLSENYDNYEYLLFETQYLNGIAGVSTTWILTGHIEQQENFTYGGNNFNSSIGLWCANSWLAIYFTGDNTFKVGAFEGNDGALIISNIYGIN